MDIVKIIIGIIIWFVVPILTNDAIKKKAYKKAIAMLCQIMSLFS